MGITAAGVGAAASVASAATNNGTSLFGGNKAAGGSQQSQYLQLLEQQQNQVNTAPFIGAGQYATNALQSGLQSGAFGTPIDLSRMPTSDQVPQAPGPFVWNPTMEGLAATPGYQFTLGQGTMAAQSSAAARGLGMSGPAMRGAVDYATGKASQTYDQQLTNALNINTQGLNIYGKQLAGYQAQGAQFQNQFDDYWNNQKNPFSQYLDLAKLGQAAAANQAVTGTDAAKNIGAAAQVGAAQQGVGIAQAGNALAGTLNSPQVQQALQSWGSNAYPSGNVSGTQNNTGLLQGSYTTPSGNATIPTNTWYS